MWRKLRLAVLSAATALPMLGFANFASALTVSPVLIEYDLAAGDAVVGSVKLTNMEATAQTFYPVVQDFVAGDEEGAPSFMDVSDERSLSSWISFQSTTVALEPGETKWVPYYVAVPKDAGPGGYFGGILFSTERPDVEQGVGVAAQTGPLVLIRVAGEVIEKGSITDFAVSPESATSLPVNFDVRFQNSGTVHVKPMGVVKITNMFGGTSAVIPVNAEGGNVLPDSARRFSAMWQKAELPENASELVKEWKNFGFGKYTATLILNYGDGKQVVSASDSFWVMPWMLIVLFMILVVIAVLLVMQYNKWLLSKYGKRK